MVHHAARDYAFSAKYDAAIQDPIFAASMRTELQQDDNGGVKSLLYDRQWELISLPTLGPPRKTMTPKETLTEPSLVFVSYSNFK